MFIIYKGYTWNTITINKNCTQYLLRVFEKRRLRIIYISEEEKTGKRKEEKKDGAERAGK